MSEHSKPSCQLSRKRFDCNKSSTHRNVCLIVNWASLRAFWSHWDSCSASGLLLSCDIMNQHARDRLLSALPRSTLGSKSWFLPPGSSDWLAGSYSILSSFCCPLRRPGVAKLVSNTLVSRGWPWSSDLSASDSLVCHHAQPFKNKLKLNKLWYCMPIIPVLGKRKQVEQIFKVTLSYIMSLRLIRAEWGNPPKL